MTEEEAKKEKISAEDAKRSADDLKKALEVATLAEGEVKKTAEATKLSLEEAQKLGEESKKTLLASEEVKKDLEARVDMAEARASNAEAKEKLAQEALAKVEAEVEQKITAGKDDLFDLAMYSFLMVNQNAEVSFLEDEAEGLLAKWKARLEEEKELLSLTASGSIVEDDDVGGEVTSHVAQQTETSAEMIMDQMPAEDTPVVEDAPPPQV